MVFSVVTPEIRSHARRAGAFDGVSIPILLFSFHWALVAYVNSSYVNQFISEKALGPLYSIGGIVTIIAFVFGARVLRAWGNYRLTLALALAEAAALLGLAFIPIWYVVIPLFVLHHALAPLILFTIDIFSEHDIGRDEGVTGRQRGVLLTVISFGSAFAILVSGFLIGSGEPRFAFVYVASAACILGFWWYVRKACRTFKDSRYTDVDVVGVLRHFWIEHDFRFVFIAHFLLQLFFAWMVIYTSLYLSAVIGFDWSRIGLLLFIGLFAYVLFEYPIGRIADRYLGEKEMMGAGFIILAVSTAYMGLLKVQLLLPWMITFFISRFGASLVEVTTESYFFKHTRDADAEIIGFFRASRPLSYILGALLGSVALVYVSFNAAFLLFGLCMLPGVVFALLLKDTR